MPFLSSPFALFSLLMGSGGKKGIGDPTIAIIHANGVIMTGSSATSSKKSFPPSGPGWCKRRSPRISGST